MKLTTFFQTLLESGKVQVAGDLSPFDFEDHRATLEIMRRFHAADSMDMPYAAPAFHPPAALWAAEYFYKSVHITVLRDLDEAAIRKLLVPYGGGINPEAIYSVDLVFRYTPSLFGLAKGLAPRDLLVQMLKETAAQWGFSAVGMDLGIDSDLDDILARPSLRAAYVDRIIRLKDRRRAAEPRVAPLVGEALGGFASTIWPTFER